MFNALFKLYNSSSVRTPQERFTTEAFCSVLRSDQSLLKNFLKEFAGIETEDINFNISTEKIYKNHSRRIDVIFENNSYLIFLEIKVNSSENDQEDADAQQLKAYAEILKTISKETVLLFCTKNYEPKNPALYSPIKFNQYQWWQVYDFLIKQEKSNHLVTHFLDYLDRQEIGKMHKINKYDLETMRYLVEMLKSLDANIALISPKFEARFGKPDGKSLVLSQMLDHRRVVLSKNVLGKEGVVIVGFYFGSTSVVQPKLLVYVWLNDRKDENNNYKNIRNLIDSYAGSKDDFSSSPKESVWFGFGYQKELEFFLEKENQSKLITEWCVEKMKELHDFMMKSKNEYDIPWQIRT
ncbi:MAG: hypothetical protein L3K52_02600 [Candidatus Thiothrix sulfatifontis]|nr:MAG: hypothetical protein L3K52_02600 [Candidatus Thiothrix sulfatifontis]